MCGVIGVHLDNPSKDDLKLVERVFIESRIRGMHATGMSYAYNNRITTVIKTVPADVFVSSHAIPSMDKLRLIGHCRYSTSDLLYNQPLFNTEVAIVHNGVISQELPENWSDLYGITTETKNDSELLLCTIGADPVKYWANASIAAIELHRKGAMKYYRNGKRPLYKTDLDNGYIITSTADIMHRASNGKYSATVVECSSEKDLQWTLG